MIHADYNPGDDTYMNEGCSMFAEIVCGYPPDYSKISEFFQIPDNSLTMWGDQGGDFILADYGAGFLWVTYLNDQYGDGFIQHFVQSGIPGVEGVNAALAYFSYDDTFDDAFREWRVANLILSDEPGHGKYNYKSIDFEYAFEQGYLVPIFTYDIEGNEIPPTTGVSLGTSYQQFGDVIYDTGLSRLGTYGTDYLKFTDFYKWADVWFRW